jgi:hypothetical protein
VFTLVARTDKLETTESISSAVELYIAVSFYNFNCKIFFKCPFIPEVSKQA